jgi:cytoskeleton protein RodZ
MSVGSEIKKARELKKITLETVSQRTRIPLKYLEAIEEDQFDVFASHAYAKGFIRAYAKVVGADPAALTSQFKSQVEPVAVKIEPPHAESEVPSGVAFPGFGKKVPPRRERITDESFDAVLDEPEEENSRRSSALPKPSPFLPNKLGARFLGWGLTLIFMGILFFFLAPVGVHLWKQIKLAEAKPAAVAAIPADGSQDIDGPVIADKYQHLILKGLDQSWVRVVWDNGKKIAEYDLAPGDTKIYKSENGFQLRVGNAGGVDIYFNQKALGVLGSTGEVLDITLPVSGEPVITHEDNDN